MEASAGGSLGVAIITAIGAFIGALISHFLTERRSLDLAIYKRREEAYKELWKHTAHIPKWPPREDLKFPELRAFSEELRHWYFEIGGVYLSDSARRAYGNLQEALNSPGLAAKAAPLKGPDYSALQDLCSKLRTELTHDLLSRKRMFVFSR